MEEKAFRIKSISSSSWIEFGELRKWDDDIYFRFAARFDHFSGVVGSSTLFAGSPAGAFLEASASWRSWESDKVWQALDGELSIRIVGDVLGGRYVEIVMVAGNEKLQGSISLDAEALESAANGLRDLFDQITELAQ
ncbi:hypothetical protein OSH11_19160 [Kaistia dalseonensis]|uniref:Uncharacterized protein n=1 Tax=Kaistia dalseonensis TaxID=410840 RepID=A0ABU0HAW2_9HYPH|nr:hypothetical protein [Kaistia dalseonensis]MCX5496834.1 hypothetical protein [Kaistia dalseonensis]MDQ0439460.1 hypothetical protein [Kaistia dalseonensis]